MENKNKKTAKKPEEESFETAIERLEEIAYLLEKGDAGLEESIKLFETGIKLSKRCHDLLEEAERKIEILQKGDDESIKLKKVKVKKETGETEENEDLQGSLL